MTLIQLPFLVSVGENASLQQVLFVLAFFSFYFLYIFLCFVFFFVIFGTFFFGTIFLYSHFVFFVLSFFCTFIFSYFRSVDQKISMRNRIYSFKPLISFFTSNQENYRLASYVETICFSSLALK